MEFVTKKQLHSNELLLIDKAFDASKHSVTTPGHKVGCAIMSKRGNVFVGATCERTRVIGSTCAERMAVDQMVFKGDRKPILCVIVGKFIRYGWSRDSLCTPCGVCLEMFFELIQHQGVKDLLFLLPSWNKKRFLRIKLSELYPQIGRGSWKRIGYSE